MASPSKQKGNAFEREIVNLAKKFGLKCEHTDIVAFREDRGDTYALMDMNVFLTLLKKLKG